MKRWIVVLVSFGAMAFAVCETARAEVDALARAKASLPHAEKLEPATISVFVFRDDLPLKDARVAIGPLTHWTDENGASEFLLEMITRDSSVSLTVDGLHEAVGVRTVTGEVTQVFVNLSSIGVGDVRAEEPSAESGEADLDSTKQVPVAIRVLSEETGEPIEGAQIFVQGRAESFSTGKDGVALTELPASAKTLTVFHRKFSTHTEKALAIAKGQAVGGGPLEIQYRLRPASAELEEVVVMAPQMKGSMGALIEFRRKSSGVAEVLGSEQMSKAGDGDAAASLRRVTGLTLAGGKYVYVRGLGERYSSTLLNSATLPSPEPSRRVVPLDLFPTSILESMVIQKSYSPDLPGEFGGGAIQMYAKGLPERFSARLSLSGEVGSDGGDALGYRGGSADWMGHDDGTRALPASIENVSNSGKKIEGGPNGFTEAELRALGQSFPNVWQARPRATGSIPNLNFSIGGRKGKVGVHLAGLYGAGIDVLERESNKLVLDAGRLRVDSYSSSSLTEREIRTGLAGDLGWEISSRHRLFLSGLGVRNTTDTTEVKEGFSGNADYRNTRLEWVEREIVQRQLRGEHGIGPVELGWRLSCTSARRDAPDSRSHSYIRNGDAWSLSTGGDLYRNYSALHEQADQGGVDLSGTVKTSWLGQVKWKSGFDRLEKKREFGLRRFDFQEPSAQAGIDLSASAETIFGPENFEKDGGWTVREITRATDSYSAKQTVAGLYAMVDMNPSSRWQLSTGARLETSRQDVVTYNLYDANRGEAIAGLESRDVLPVYGITWKFTPEMQARLNYSETLSRPDLKELSTAPYYDDESGQEVKGNPELRGTVIRNWDARWEWYPASDETVSVGAFAKTFENPIELILVPQSSANSWTFRNAKSARNVGVELEARRSLRFLSRDLRRWSVGSNLAWIDSRVTLDPLSAGVLTSNDRPLQGQSPYIANAQVYYDHRPRGLSLGLLYNVMGPRIREVASAPLPDVYEASFHQLDFVSSFKTVSWDILRNITVSFRAKNLLDPEVRLTQGDEVVRRHRRGRAFSLGLSASW